MLLPGRDFQLISQMKSIRFRPHSHWPREANLNSRGQMGDFLVPCPSGSTLAVQASGPWARRKWGSFEIGVTAEASPLPEQLVQHWFTEGCQTGQIVPQAKAEEADPKSCLHTLPFPPGCCWLNERKVESPRTPINKVSVSFAFSGDMELRGQMVFSRNSFDE